MNRRSTLGTIVALASGGLTGCAGVLDGDVGDPADGGADGPDPTETEGSWPPPESYEQCPRLVIRIDELPEPARREVETALSEGHYETSDELYIPHVLDPEQSYVAAEGAHYRANVEDRGTATRLELTEATPSKGTHSVAVRNRSDDSLTLDLRVTYRPEDAVVLDASASIDPGDRSTLGEFDRRLGEYRADVDAGEVAETLTWQEEEHAEPLATIVIEDGDAYPEPRAVADPISCEMVWEG